MKFIDEEVEQQLKKFSESKTGNAISIDENALEVFLFNIDPQNYLELIRELEKIGFDGEIKLVCFTPEDNRIDKFLSILEASRK